MAGQVLNDSKNVSQTTVTTNGTSKYDPGTPGGYEPTASELGMSRRTSTVSAATSQASNVHLLNGHSKVPHGSSNRSNGVSDGQHSRSADLEKAKALQSSHRHGPEDYFNPIIKKFVAENDYKTGEPLDGIKRKEMAAYYRWRPGTDVGQALMDGRDEDAINGILTTKKLGSWVSRRSDHVVTDLHLACAFGALNVVNALLEVTDMQSVNNADFIRKVPFAPHLPLDYAAVGGHVEIVAALIKAGHIVESASITPLCLAVQYKAYGVIDLLLEYGSDPLAPCDYGGPLHRACKTNNTLLVRALSSVMQKEKSCIVSFQILHPLPLQHPSYFGLGHTALLHIKVDPLAWAVFNGSFEAVETLIGLGMPTDIEYGAEFVSGGKRVSHVTALSLAAAKGLTEMVELLISRPLNQKIKDHAFAAAIYNKEDQIAKMLSSAGAKNSFVIKAWGKWLGVDGVASRPVSAEVEA